jgi:hypothetical protein
VLDWLSHFWGALQCEVDCVTSRIFTEHFKHNSRIILQDIGASDCLASAEWALRVWEEFPAATIFASDVILCLREIRLPTGEVFFCEPDGTPVQYVWAPWIVPLDRSWSRGDWVNRVLQMWALWRFKRVPQTQLTNCWYEPPAMRNPPGISRVSLVHPEALALAHADQRFVIEEQSVFDPLRRKVDVVRTMNILNRAYFTETTILAAARSVWESLRPDGLWIVGRTLEETRRRVNATTIFRRSPDGFRSLERLNGGSEIERLVVDQF